MIFLAFFIGTLATIIGALPPGASNLAVIKTTLQENHQESLKVSYGAGFGEVLLALIAFSSGMVVQDFFEMHIWLQYMTAVLLAIVGSYFLIHKTSQAKKHKKQSSKYLLGFTLGVINPPVLIYWILVFSFLSNSMMGVGDYPLLWLLLFLGGVFLGKVGTLYGYSKFGLRVQKKNNTAKSNINRYIGIALLILSGIQLIKLLVL